MTFQLYEAICSQLETLEKRSIIYNFILNLLTLSAHARDGYSSHFVCLSVRLSVCHVSILEKAPISGLKLTSVYILGDDLSPLNVALF